MVLRIKIPATDWEKVFVNYISDEGLATRKYKVPQIQGQQLKRKKKRHKNLNTHQRIYMNGKK